MRLQLPLLLTSYLSSRNKVGKIERSLPPPLPITLEAALAAKNVLDHGRLQEIDATGAVISDTDPKRIQREWMAPLEAALKYWFDLPEQVPNLQLISVYARGSIPRGLALANRSDIDTVGFAVIGGSGCSNCNSKEADAAIAVWQGRRGERESSIRQQFPFVAGLEMRLVALPETSALGQWLLMAADAKDDASSYALNAKELNTLDAFRIASQGLLLYGHDLVSRFPPPVPAPRSELTLHADLVKATTAIRGRRFSDPLQKGGERMMTDDEILNIARWAGKRALRSGMELAIVMKGYQFFSRDLLQCHRAIANAIGLAVEVHSLRVLQLTCMPTDAIEKRGGAAAVALELLIAARALHQELQKEFPK